MAELHASRARIHLLVNPRAGNGRASRRVRDARAALETAGDVTVHETQLAGDEARLAGEASLAGATVLAVLGGDGTVSHAARGLVYSGSALPLAILAAGSGNDTAKSLGAPVHDYGAMARLILRGGVRSIDVGTIDDVPFVNAAGFGFDAQVVARTSHGGRRVGAVSYALTALASMHNCRGFDAVARDALAGDAAAGDAARPRHLMLVFANGRHFGGMFTIAPRARLDDGLLDMVDLHDAGTFRRLAMFSRAALGRLEGVRGVHTRQISEMSVSFDAPPQFEADGELHQAKGSVVRVGCLPRVLRLVSG